jgi:hypothetical protein
MYYVVEVLLVVKKMTFQSETYPVGKGCGHSVDNFNVAFHKRDRITHSDRF